MRRNRPATGVLLGVLVALAAASCTGSADVTPTPTPSLISPSPTARSPIPRPPKSPVPPQPSGDPFSPIGTGAPHSPRVSTASDDDLRTFAYATTDEAAMATQTAAMARTVSHLATDAAQRAVEAVQADAQRLLDQAERLEADSGAAADRLRPLSPSSAALAVVHRDGAAAFGLTQQYAATAVALANSAADLDAEEFAQVAEEAAGMAGTAADLATAYDNLTEALTVWARINPTDAAKALALYGG